MPPRPLDRPPVAPSSLNHRRRPTNSTTTGILPFQPVAEPSLPVGNNEHASTSARSGDHQRRGSQSIDLAMTAGWWQRFCPCGASPSAVASGCVPGHDAMIYQVLNSSCIPKLLISEVCHGGEMKKVDITDIEKNLRGPRIPEDRLKSSSTRQAGEACCVTTLLQKCRTFVSHAGKEEALTSDTRSSHETIGKRIKKLTRPQIPWCHR